MNITSRIIALLIPALVVGFLASGPSSAEPQSAANCGNQTLPLNAGGQPTTVDQQGRECVLAHPVTAATGKITKNSTAVSATTSATLAPANLNRLSMVIQCASGGVNIDETGGVLASATTGGTVVMPTGTYVTYIPPVTTLTAVTAYTATAQTCTLTEYTK